MSANGGASTRLPRPLGGFLLGILPLLVMLAADVWSGLFVVYLVCELPYALIGGLLHLCHLCERPAQEPYYCALFVCVGALAASALSIPLMRRGYRPFCGAFIAGCVLTSLVSSFFQGWRVLL